jgi:glycosyltransferase involved in cell wall biosynthesis
MKEKEPLISVIVPVYNVEQYLKECICSIIYQTYKKLEIILINDGSTDNSLRICRQFEKMDPRITVIDQKNQGLSGARNTGLLNMRGDYFTFVDSDDYIDIDLIDKQLETMLNLGCDIVLAGTTYVWPDHSAKEVPSATRIISSVDLLEHFFKQRNGILHTAWGKLFKSSIKEEIRFPVGKLYEDQFVIYSIVLNNRCAVMNDSTYHYRGRTGSILNDRGNIEKKSLDMMESMIVVRDVVSRLCPEAESMMDYKIATDAIVLIRYNLIGKKFNDSYVFAMKEIKRIRFDMLRSMGLDWRRLLQFLLMKHCIQIYKILFTIRNRG